MASLPVPLLPRHSLSVVLLSTTLSLREFKWLFKFPFVRDTLLSSVLLIMLQIITLHFGREFSIKVLRLRYLSSTTREDSSRQLFVPTCKIIILVRFCNKGRKRSCISLADASGKEWNSHSRYSKNENPSGCNFNITSDCDYLIQ